MSGTDKSSEFTNAVQTCELDRQLVSDERLDVLIDHGVPDGLAPQDFTYIVSELKRRRAHEANALINDLVKAFERLPDSTVRLAAFDALRKRWCEHCGIVQPLHDYCQCMADE